MIIKNSTVSLLPFGARGFFGPSSRLFAPDDNGDPGTGTGGAGDSKVPAAFTEEQQKAIDTAVIATVNKAVTSQLSRTLPKMIEAAMAPVLEKLKPAEPKTPEGDDPAKTPGKKMADPETERLRLEVDRLTKIADESQKREKKATEDAKNDKIRAALIEAYTEKTGSAAMARPLAIAAMAEGLTDLDDNGNPVMKVKVPLYQGSTQTEERFLGIADAIENWSKTPDAEVFVKPPTPTSGGRPVGGRLGGKGIQTGAAPKLSDPNGVAALEAKIRNDAKQQGFNLEE